MSDIQRETLGSIARLAEQMSYAAMNGLMDTLKAQMGTLQRLMAKLETGGRYGEFV